MTIEEKRKAVVKYCGTSDCPNCAITGMCGEREEPWTSDSSYLVEEAYAVLHPEEPAPKILDSGSRTAYSTGAVRDCKEGKGRCDLMPLDVLGKILDDDAQAELWYIDQFRRMGKTESLVLVIKKFASQKTPGATPDIKICNNMLEVSKHFEEGAKKYGPNNWQKGIPVHSYIDSAVRHYLKYRAGWTDEPHDRAFVWNLMCCIWTMEHHPELDDFTEKGAKENDE